MVDGGIGPLRTMQRFVRCRFERCIEPQELRANAVERLGALTDKGVEIAGVRQPARGPVGKIPHPGIRRMHVGDA